MQRLAKSEVRSGSKRRSPLSDQTTSRPRMMPPKVFEALLVNQLVREDDLLLVASSDRASAAQLQLLADDRKWSYRYAIRKALVMNPITPRFAAASFLRSLTARDLRLIHRNPKTSVYVRRCIESIQPVASDVQ